MPYLLLVSAVTKLYKNFIKGWLHKMRKVLRILCNKSFLEILFYALHVTNLFLNFILALYVTNLF
jgi:hypothetical protein